MITRLVALTLLTAATTNAQSIIAHRGASHDAPENTVAAFKLAWQRGADGIEGDFYLSRDGKVVCFHDKTTERVSPSVPTMTVKMSDAGELTKLDVGSWKSPDYAGERVPLLSDVLATVPKDGLFFVELKAGPEIVAPVLKVLDEGDVPAERLTIIAFDEDAVQEVRRLRPDLKANWLTSFKQDKETGKWTPTVGEVIETLKSCDATGLGCKAERGVVTAEFIRAVRNAGFGFHVWTVNEPADARHWAELGVDSITTDRPAVIRDTITAPAVAK